MQEALTSPPRTIPLTTLSSLLPLVHLCAEHDLSLEQEAVKQFERYLELLLKFNRSMNLIGPLSAEQIVEELLCDSICPGIIAPPQGSILDVGSGAGLPGLPLKILYPDCPITLIEPRKKRASFLRIVIAKLGLTQAEVLNLRHEDAQDLGHDYVISKAFAPPLDWLELAEGMVAPGGRIVCMSRASMSEALDERARSLSLSRLASITSPPISRTSEDEGAEDARVSYIYESSGA